MSCPSAQMGTCERSLPVFRCPSPSQRGEDHSRDTPPPPRLLSFPAQTLRCAQIPPSPAFYSAVFEPALCESRQRPLSGTPMTIAEALGHPQLCHDGCPAGVSQPSPLVEGFAGSWRVGGSSLQLPTRQPPGLCLKAAPTSSSG